MINNENDSSHLIRGIRVLSIFSLCTHRANSKIFLEELSHFANDTMWLNPVIQGILEKLEPTKTNERL